MKKAIDAAVAAIDGETVYLGLSVKNQGWNTYPKGGSPCTGTYPDVLCKSQLWLIVKFWDYIKEHKSMKGKDLSLLLMGANIPNTLNVIVLTDASYSGAEAMNLHNLFEKASDADSKKCHIVIPVGMYVEKAAVGLQYEERFMCNAHFGDKRCGAGKVVEKGCTDEKEGTYADTDGGDFILSFKIADWLSLDASDDLKDLLPDIKAPYKTKRP